MRKIIVGLAGLAAAGLAAVTPGFGAAAGEERPLAERLRATHVHGLAVDRSDPRRLLDETIMPLVRKLQAETTMGESR